MKTIVVFGAGLAALGLAACNFGVSSPQRKPGLWEQTMQSDRTPTPVVSRWCFDAASDRQMPVLGRRPGGRRGPMAAACKVNTAKSGGAFVTDSQCSFGGASISNHSVVSGDFASKYTVVRTANVTGSPDPSRNGQHKLTETWVFKGACPPEIGPGQVQKPNGDVVDMASLRFGGRGGGGGGPGGGGGGAAGGGGGGGGGGQ